MNIKLLYKGSEFKVDFSAPLDISIPLRPGGPICFHAPEVKLSPVRAGDFVGSITEGSPVNFFNVTYNPHGNGTHTESNGHIKSDQQTINQTLRQFHFIAKLISVEPERLENGDGVITKEQLVQRISPTDEVEALVLRTYPNDKSKLIRNYSDTNPPYLTADAMQYIVDLNIHHLLLDLPSVDREQDGGILLAHNIFWKSDSLDRSNCTITEMIFVPDAVHDGIYLLNLMISPLELDAVSSKPVLYSLF